MGGLISVIVTVFNDKENLPRCLHSLISQEYPDLEIIVVDDGSTDGSSEICDMFAHTYTRIRCFHKENGGLSCARNFGTEKATGDWIGFVDADDYIESKMYSQLAEEIEKTSKKIINCSIITENMQGQRVPHLYFQSAPTSAVDLSQEEALMHFLNPMDRYLNWSVCNKIFHYSIIEGIRFESGRMYAEDFDFCLHIILNSDGIRFVPAQLYHHVIRQGSLSTTRELSASLYDRVFFANKAVDTIQRKCISKKLESLVKVYQTVMAIITIKTYYSCSDREKRIKYMKENNQSKSIIDKNLAEVWPFFRGKERIKLIIARYIPWIFFVIQ